MQGSDLEVVLPPRPITGITEMVLDECEETTLHDVNIEEEMRRKQQQQAQEAYEEDDDMHGGAQRVLLKGHPYFKKLLEKEGGGNPSTTPDHPSEENSAIPSGALVSVWSETREGNQQCQKLRALPSRLQQHIIFRHRLLLGGRIICQVLCITSHCGQ
nr:DnaJ protein homolog [Ipomoea batatas]